jgi:DNA-binding SARP family transcriptional activator
MVLGPLELREGGEVVALRRGRPRRLLLSLLLRAGEPVASDTLIEELWGEDEPKNAANALQILVSYLRKVLEPGAGQLEIETGPGSYRLRLGSTYVDAHHFEDVVRTAVEMEPAARRVALDAALDLWRGAPFAELAYEDFAQGDIVRLEELHLDAIELRNEAMLELGLHREVLGPIRQLVVEHPLRERFHAQLMLALYRSGRQADALRTFDEARTILVEELGLDPGPELQSLQRAILSQDPGIAAPTPPPSRPLLVPAPLAEDATTPSRAPAVPPEDTVGRAEALVPWNWCP